MKAIVWTAYGPPEVLQLQDVPTPTPGEGEILVRNRAASVFAGDCELRRFDLPPLFWLPVRLLVGIRRPRVRVLGQEVSGEVTAVGPGVTEFQVGDQVVGSTEMRFGGYAEYTCLSATGPVALKPSGVSHAEAVTVPVGGVNALHFFRRADIRSGDRVLLVGAGGSIGTYLLQLAKLQGAEVWAVDAGPKLGMLEALGADRVVDYRREALSSLGARFDAVFNIHRDSGFRAGWKLLKPDGHLLLVNLFLNQVLRGWMLGLFSRKRVSTALAVPISGATLAELLELMVEGELKAVIDREYRLDQIVEAHHYVDAGHKAGHLVIRLNE